MAEDPAAPPKPPPPPPPPPTAAAAAEVAPSVAENVPTVPVPAAAKPSDDSVPGGDEGAQKKAADDGARAAADVIAEETAKANGRHETSVPDKSFESLNMFERFKRAPPIKDPSGNVMALGKLVPNTLLFGMVVAEDEGRDHFRDHVQRVLRSAKALQLAGEARELDLLRSTSTTCGARLRRGW